MGIKIPLDVMMKISGKSKEEFENEEKVKEQNKKNEQKERKKIEELNKININELYNKYDLYISNKKINSEYFSELSKDLVYKFKSENLTSTKLREYYNSINNLYNSYNDENELKINLFMILAKANYDYGRKKIATKSFINFLEINISNLFNKDFEKENFTIFKKHFETVIAYAKGVLSDK
ncbi:MAG: type III-A CRISPR-associated protein Csm2 [Candidatus Gracilibacteria bacterium]|nr:type III-A CRISPR-associated protein Csm2 [Candidatus Gracilibacteria bacterium]